MKEFRKTEDGLFICEECDMLCKNKLGLAIHIRHSHNHKHKEYFDKWLKEDDGICKICGKKTNFKNFYYGYKNCCSKKCSKIFTQHQTEKGCIKKYSVNNAYQIKHIREKALKLAHSNDATEKRKNTILKLYGVNNAMQSEEIKEKNKQICLEKYGVENPLQSEEIRKKGKQTCLEKYGNETYNNREQAKQTCLEKYGVEHVAQDIKIFNKGLKTRFLIHKYKNTNLTYQGSYELNFLDIFCDQFPDMQNGLSFKYIFRDKNKVYHSDFYIPHLNFIIEIKSSWTLTQDIEVEEKKKATIANGFNYLMILDKKYNELVNYCS